VSESPEDVAGLFQRTLQISRALAERLVAGGFTCLDEIAYVPFNELREIGGLWEEETTALRNAARRHLLTEELRRQDGFDHGLPDA
jgi:N utilization substance protein A